MNNRSIQHFLISIFLLTLFISCTSNICNQQMTSYLKVNFYNRVTKQDSALGAISVYCLNCLTKDSIYPRTYSDSTILLPLSALHDTSSSAFIITIDTVHIDTVTLLGTPYPVRQDTLIAYYKRSMSFISYECGFLPEFKLDSIRFNGQLPTDSVAISQKNVSTNNVTNYQIFMTPKNYFRILRYNKGKQ